MKRKNDESKYEKVFLFYFFNSPNWLHYISVLDFLMWTFLQAKPKDKVTGEKLLREYAVST